MQIFLRSLFLVHLVINLFFGNQRYGSNEKLHATQTLAIISLTSKNFRFEIN